jgi:hypothetical protein
MSDLAAKGHSVTVHQIALACKSPEAFRMLLVLNGDRLVQDLIPILMRILFTRAL